MSDNQAVQEVPQFPIPVGGETFVFVPFTTKPRKHKGVEKPGETFPILAAKDPETRGAFLTALLRDAAHLNKGGDDILFFRLFENLFEAANDATGDSEDPADFAKALANTRRVAGTRTLSEIQALTSETILEFTRVQAMIADPSASQEEKDAAAAARAKEGISLEDAVRRFAAAKRQLSDLGRQVEEAQQKKEARRAAREKKAAEKKAAAPAVEATPAAN